jgi:hypothetical protein
MPSHEKSPNNQVTACIKSQARLRSVLLRLSKGLSQGADSHCPHSVQQAEVGFFWLAICTFMQSADILHDTSTPQIDGLSIGTSEFTPIRSCQI